MRQRVGESDADFKARRAAYDRTRGSNNSELAQVQAKLDKALATITEMTEREREEKLRSSMQFKPVIIPPKKHRPGSPGMPATIWSDWHCGETVDIRETGGLNEFNEQIFGLRVKNLVHGTISLLRDYSGQRPVDPGMWVCLGGDMVSGLIHEELVETNWGNIVDQALTCGSAIEGGLLALADEFGEVNVAGVPGNHGRTTSRPRGKHRATDSYDRSIYLSVAKHLAKDKRFKFYIPSDVDIRFDIYGHRFLLTHGDSLGVKGGDGIIGAIGPIARGAYKVGRSEAQIGRDFDTLIMGHWHQYIPRSDSLGVIVNGTLKGYDEYARIFLRARFARPSQALWLVSPKHGIAAQWAVHV